jgi:hypothetical protein
MYPAEIKMDSGLRPLLSGENEALQKKRDARQFPRKIQRYRIVIPAKAGIQCL